MVNSGVLWVGLLALFNRVKQGALGCKRCTVDRRVQISHRELSKQEHSVEYIPNPCQHTLL